jgi:hypothetical protein
MTILTTNPFHHTSQSTQADHEAVFIASLHEAMIENGISVGQAEITNFYVALKSKPLAILTGPAQSGKIALVQGLAQSLVERESLHVQIFTGHPWWAERCVDIANHTRLHERFSTEKMLSIIEDAGQPDNANQVFIACLTRISPAELLSFFTEASLQLQNGQIIKLGDTHLSEPIPFSSNLRLIGTMDTPSFDWWDNDLLLSTTVIQWPQASILHDPMFNRGILLEEHEFLQSCILSRDMAYRKMLPVLQQQRQPLYSLLQVGAVLEKYIAVSMDRILDEVMIYLANSWSGLGHGLFHSSPDRNLAIALDLAIAQILLPRAADAIQSIETLRTRLNIVFADQFRRSTAFVSALSVQG